LRLIALIENARVVRRILRLLALWTNRPELRPPRAPPSEVLEIENQLSRASDDMF
jgi:hypothetical protein